MKLESFPMQSRMLMLTTKCNNKCIICQDSGQGVDQLFKQKIMKTFSQIKREVDCCISNGVKNISIYGGEPFLNKNMLPALDYISRFDVNVFIFSNARVFSDKSMVKRLHKLKSVRVQTSLFSYNKNTHDYITGMPGSYSQTIAGIKNLVEENILVGVTIVLTKKNLQGLRKTVEFLVSLGVKDIKISGLINQGRMLGRQDLAPDFSAVKIEIKRVFDWTGIERTRLSFEKLPQCVLPMGVEKFFVFEPQHKGKMVSCPESKERCVKCDFRNKCMCY